MVGWSKITAQRAMSRDMEAHVEKAHALVTTHKAQKALGPTDIDSSP